ncbi:DUF2490 domain-containing protein [Flavobacterium amniphilum]|uniref:DUF2490 domain-containing protein n=1 Tax=Flavobacterium amniphilum TaxID=1834035 RepID=UPI00202A6884|nr:DUF2490 domain-containing protein [Flavobacterium amniphilum]MCL9804674.1 DUF2490 domain-containing protein [Flavobacterium amniphilum]
MLKFNSIKPLILIGFLAFGFVLDIQAQTKNSNNDIWFHYVGKNMLTKKLSFTFEGTLRFANGFDEKQQWFVRPSVDYQFAKWFTGSIGYSHYNTYSYGNPAMNKISIPEDHLWFQGTFVHNSGDFKFTHRLRDELRYVDVAVKDPVTEEFEIDHYEYRNRFRYMFLLNHPITKKEEATKLFAFFGDEVFMNLGSNAGKTFLNQNRIIGGVGYNINKHHQLQLSYIHQNIWNYPNTFQESNPTVRLSYITNFDWYQKAE